MGMIGYFMAVDNDRMNEILTEGFGYDEVDISDEGTLDIDKSWMAIWFTLCCSNVASAAYVVPLSGRHVIPYAMENGFEWGAFYLRREWVRQANKYLKTLTEKEFRRLYDFHAMEEAKIYPILPGEDEEEFYRYIYAYMRDIKEFYRAAADEDKGIIFYII